MMATWMEVNVQYGLSECFNTHPALTKGTTGGFQWLHHKLAPMPSRLKTGRG